MKNRKNYVWVLLAVIVLVIGGLFASANSSPESLLYSLRTNVWEKAVLMTKGNDFNKANYHLQLADQRLSELESLKAKNTLNSAAGNKVRDNFNNETIAVQNLILSLTKTEGANSQKVLQLSERLDVQIEHAKAIFNIDEPEVLDEGVPLPKATSTATSTQSVKVINKSKK